MNKNTKELTNISKIVKIEISHMFVTVERQSENVTRFHHLHEEMLPNH
jgi:hypothetical protein